MKPIRLALSLSLFPFTACTVTFCGPGYTASELYGVTRNPWRLDRTPQSCAFAQLDRPVSFDLNDIVPGLR